MSAGAKELLRIARETAVEAGELAARLRREGVTVEGTKSSPIDIVTAADKAAEDLIRGRLAAARPDDGFLGEESGAEGGSSGLTWVVDPIDGTVNYLYDLPNWSVSIAVVEGDPDPASWRPLAGAVAAPALGELFTASARRRRAPRGPGAARAGAGRARPGARVDGVPLHAGGARQPGAGRGAASSRSCATCAAPGARRSTSHPWRRDASTPSSSRASTPGTRPRAVCSSPRRAAGSPGSRGRPPASGW